MEIEEELIQVIVERAGITEDQAKIAVETVVAYLKEKLPDPVENLIETVTSGQDVIRQATGLLGELGALLGRR